MASTTTNEFELKSLARFCDLAEETLGAVPPVQGCEQTPLVTLGEALEPLHALVPGAKQRLALLNDRQRQVQDGLTFDESASIMLYTMHWQTEEDSFSLLLNRALRDVNRERVKPWLLYLKLFMHSLAKLPSLHCHVYRGVQSDLSGEYPLGKAFTWWGFALCTQSLEGFEAEQVDERSEQRTRFKVECRSAKDIRNHTFEPTDRHVLLSSALRYRVMSLLDSDHGLHIIHVKEIESSAMSSLGNDRTSSISLSFSQRKPSINISIGETSFCSLVLKLTGSSSTYRNQRLEDLLTLAKPNSSIDLSARELIDQDMAIVIQRAVFDKKCPALHLTGNKLSGDSLSLLSDALYSATTLVELDLSDNHIANPGVRNLIRVLSSNKARLQKLHLGSNQISDEGVQLLADMLKANRSLTHLMLNRNQITSDGVHSLSNALALHNTTLRVLSLASNQLIADMSVDSLIAMLKENSTLQGLDVRWCGLSQQGDQRLRRAVIDKSSFQLFSNVQENLSVAHGGLDCLCLAVLRQRIMEFPESTSA